MQANSNVDQAQAGNTTLLNISFTVASRILTLPLRFLNRIRRFDDVLNHDYSVEVPLRTDDASNAHLNGSQETLGGPGMVPMPGPWGFLTSGYCVGLFIMAIVLNRIQNLVVPPRRSTTHRTHTGRRTYQGYANIGRILLSLLFPTNFSSLLSRFLFRVPSIYLLGRCLSIWLTLLLQATNLFPSWQWSWLQAINSWAAHMEMQDICWTTFIAVCVTLAVGALTSGVEGYNPSGNAPFNLFGYAFLLYLYSSSLTHVTKAKGISSRPDKHALVIIILPLAQLTLTHCLEIRTRWARERLIPSTIFGVLALIHFHSVVWVSPASFPLPNYVPCIVNSALVLIILLTCLLNMLTQLLVNGTISRPTLGHSALMPHHDEDFSIVLFRLGTASLEATSVAGLGNEVGGVVRADPHVAHGSTNVMEIDRSGVRDVPHGDGRGGRRRYKHGFANKIEKVKANATHTDLWMDTVMNAIWRREALRFVTAFFKVGRGIWRLLRSSVQRNARDEGLVEEQVPVEVQGDEEPVDDYERFLRGEPVSDDDDDDFDEALHDSADESSLSLTDDEAEEGESAGETAQLYEDLSISSVTPAPLLLAHMTDSSTSPLTRRRYRRLVSGSRLQAADSSDSDEYARFVQARRDEKAATVNGRDVSTEERRRNCVICTVEPRDIICWPCRCLALCDDCRGNLASRSSASKHSCPCCRQTVEGYSKIYIP